jgi:1-deoxy-D-xylulose-5-phosphate reductoisomerase
MIERRIILLGSTGSIGTQACQVIAHLNALAARGESPVSFRVVGLAAGRNLSTLLEQAAQFPEARLALASGATGAELSVSDSGLPRRLAEAHRGPDAALELVRSTPCDIVLGAMVGSSGLPATLEALNRGIDVALANKETLVAAGSLVVPAALASGARLLPVDSEHSALWQCLAGAEPSQSGTETPGSCAPPPLAAAPPSVARLVLTASGGPFRTWTRERIEHATPEQALNHPTWTMGPKVTIDSASLTNKALEVVEAHWLYAMPADRIDVLVHPQSIVHSFVEFVDGSVISQLGSPDMRCPIQYALCWPHRPQGVCRKLDWTKMSRLEFEPPDHDRFPALALAYEVIRSGGTAGAIFNAANEEAVESFLAAKGAMPFGMIPRLAARALREIGVSPARDLRDVLEADRQARALVRRLLADATLVTGTAAADARQRTRA